MIKYFINAADGKAVEEIFEPQKNCWIHLATPSLEEISAISSLTNIAEQMLKSALDEEEAAHLDSDGSDRMVVVDIPKMIGKDDTYEIFTVPLAIIQSENYLVTVCTRSTSVLNDFFSGKIKNVCITEKARLTYQIMYNNLTRFLFYLRQIDKASDRTQVALSKSMQNKELLRLLSLQKSLVFFSSSLGANYAVAQKLTNTCLSKATDEEREILEDVIIENRQAIEMCSVYREIIKSSMDAFASVVNNEQNVIMKILTAITIVLAIPTVLAGFWGMNTMVPFEGQIWGFWIVVCISVVLSLVIVIIMIKNKML